MYMRHSGHLRRTLPPIFLNDPRQIVASEEIESGTMKVTEGVSTSGHPTLTLAICFYFGSEVIVHPTLVKNPNFQDPLLSAKRTQKGPENTPWHTDNEIFIASCFVSGILSTKVQKDSNRGLGYVPRGLHELH